MTDAYRDVGEIIGNELGGTPVEVAPGMELADIPGWDSVALAGVILAIEGRLGHALDRDLIDHLHSVDDLVKILSKAA